MPDIQRALKNVKSCGYSDSISKQITHLRGMEFNCYYIWRHFGLLDETIMFKLSRYKKLCQSIANSFEVKINFFLLILVVSLFNSNSIKIYILATS